MEIRYVHRLSRILPASLIMLHSSDNIITYMNQKWMPTTSAHISSYCNQNTSTMDEHTQFDCILGPTLGFGRGVWILVWSKRKVKI